MVICQSTGELLEVPLLKLLLAITGADFMFASF